MKHLDEIDYLRGFAIIFVLTWHTYVLRYFEEGTDYNVQSLNSFAVPTFFFISGCVLTYVYRERKLDSLCALKRFYKNRILYTLVPYFIWAFVYTLIVLHPRPSDINSFLFQFISRTLTGDWIVLWFVAIIFQFYLLFPLLLKLLDSYRKLQVFTILVLFLTLGIYTFPSLSSMDKRFFVPWLFYFMLGMSVGYNWETAMAFLKKPTMKLPISMAWMALLIILPIAHAGIHGTYFTLDILAYASFTIIFLLISVKPSSVILKFFKITGTHAYGIYLCHLPALRVLSFILRSVNITRTPILDFVLTAITSIIFTLLVRRLPFGKFVVGR